MPYIYRYIKYCPNAETDEDILYYSSDYYDTNFCIQVNNNLQTLLTIIDLVKYKSNTPWIYKVSLDGRLNNNIKPMFMLERMDEFPLFFDFRNKVACQRYQAALKFNHNTDSRITLIQKNMVKPPKKR